MAITILIHMVGEDPIVAEVNQMPNSADQFLICQGPHRRDGKDVSYLQPETHSMLIPWHRIHCVEFLTPAEAREEVITFVRE